MGVIVPADINALRKNWNEVHAPAVAARAAIPFRSGDGLSSIQELIDVYDSIASEYDYVDTNNKRHVLQLLGRSTPAGTIGVLMSWWSYKASPDPADTTKLFAYSIPPVAAVAAAPARSFKKPLVGWSGAGRFARTIEGEDGFFEFSVSPWTKGAYVGVVPVTGTQNDVSIPDAHTAFYFKPDKVSGASQTTLVRAGKGFKPPITVPTPMWAEPRYRILRFKGYLYFQTLDPGTGAKLWEHVVLDPFPGVGLCLDVLLYQQDDEVTYPVRVDPVNEPDLWDEAFGEAPVLRVNAAYSPYRSLWQDDVHDVPGASALHIRATQPAIYAEMELNPTPQINANFRHLQALFTSRNGALPANFDWLGFWAVAPSPQVALHFVDGTLPGGMFLIQALAPTFTSAVEFSRPVATANVDLATLNLTEKLIALSVSKSGSTIDLESSVTWTATGDWDFIHTPHNINSGLSLGFSVAYTATIEQRVQLGTLLIVDDVAGADSSDTTVYSVNLDTGAVSIYDGFEFFSIGEVSGAEYLLRGDNRLRTLDEFVVFGPDPDTDDPPSPINAMVDFGGTGFDTATHMNIDSMWLEVDLPMGSGLGAIVNSAVRVSTVGEFGGPRVFTYATDNHDPTFRAIFGRGLSGRSLRTTYLAEVTTQLDVTAVELSVNRGSRRRRPGPA